MALLSGMSMSGFFSFWATSARRMSVAVTGASGTWAAGPALAIGAAAGAAAVGALEGADGASPPPAAGSGSSSTGSTS
jgi:hypothetical protein|tara:strand:- start:10058 stop:10291 length:234 start_codon:yes stop_codon:yes gene_type:complete